MAGTVQPYIPDKLGFVIYDVIGSTIITYRVGPDGISPTLGIIHMANCHFKDFSSHLAPPNYHADTIVGFYEGLLAADRDGTLTLDVLVERVKTHFGNPNQTQQQPGQ